MIRVIVNGAGGTMGQKVVQAIEAREDFTVAAMIDPSGAEDMLPSMYSFNGAADVVIDFSHHQGTKELLTICKERKLPVVLCTTGHTQEEINFIEAMGQSIPIFFSGNMSVGIALLEKLLKATLKSFSGDIEILETHHNRKEDAPSGTALMLARAAQEIHPDYQIKTGRSGHEKRETNEIGIQSLRYGNVVGTHEIMVGTASQTITLKHEAHDRALFAEGACDAAAYLIGKEPGLYNMDDMLNA